MSRSSRRVHVATDTHQTTLVAETPLLAEEYLLGGMEKEEQDEWPELRHSSFPLCAARGKFLKAVQRRQASHLLSSDLVCFPTRIVREKIVSMGRDAHRIDPDATTKQNCMPLYQYFLSTYP